MQGDRTLSKKYVKYIMNASFLIALFGITYFMLFRDQELGEIIHFLAMAKNSYLYLGIGFVVIFVCSESLIIYELMKAVRQRIPLIQCIKYSFIGFFFSAVTPSATGGQPMQMLYMSWDGVSVSTSSVVLIIVTAIYKIVLILLCGILGFLNWSSVSAHLSDIWILVLFGVVANVVFIVFLMVVIFKQSFAKKIIGRSILWFGKCGFLKHKDKWLKKALRAVKRYEISASYIKENKRVLVRCFIITLIQRTVLFAVTYLIYKAFALYGHSAVEIITLQAFIALAADSLPLPGGIGANESSFLILFHDIFTEELVLPGLLLSRGITYYALIIMSATVTLIAYFLKGKKKIVESGVNYDDRIL